MYDEATADLICARLAGGLSLRRICRGRGMPNRSTVLRWLEQVPEFAAKYARAHEAQAEFHHDEMEEIERGVLAGEIDFKAANVVLGNKRWRMEKLKPRKYGAKVELNGPGGGAILVQAVTGVPQVGDEPDATQQD